MIRTRIAVSFLLASVTTSLAGRMDTDNAMWSSPEEEATRDQLMELMTCAVESDTLTASQIDQVACNWFVAEALHGLYRVEDFAGTTNGHWLTANEIADHVRSNDNWSDLRPANSRSVLGDAAQGAGNGQPVIAALAGDRHGHVAVILPGALETATKAPWADGSGRQLKVPNSAAFSLNDVSKAEVGCRPSAAFSDPTVVEIFWRLK